MVGNIHVVLGVLVRRLTSGIPRSRNRLRCLTLVEEENLDRNSHIEVHMFAEFFFIFCLAAVDDYGDGIRKLLILRNINHELEGPDGVALRAFRVGTFHLDIVSIKKDFTIFETLRRRNRESFLHGLISLLVAGSRDHNVRCVDVEIHVDDFELIGLLVREWRIVGGWIRVVTLFSWSECKIDFGIELVG